MHDETECLRFLPLEAPRIGSPELPELLDFVGIDATLHYIKPNESIPAGIQNHGNLTPLQLFK